MTMTNINAEILYEVTKAGCGLAVHTTAYAPG